MTEKEDEQGKKVGMDGVWLWCGGKGGGQGGADKAARVAQCGSGDSVRSSNTKQTPNVYISVLEPLTPKLD